jgi:hypothetical protein
MISIRSILEDDRYTHYKVYNSAINDFIETKVIEDEQVWVTLSPTFDAKHALHKNNIEYILDVVKDEQHIPIVWNNIHLIPVIGIEEGSFDIIFDESICMGDVY